MPGPEPRDGEAHDISCSKHVAVFKPSRRDYPVASMELSEDERSQATMHSHDALVNNRNKGSEKLHGDKDRRHRNRALFLKSLFLWLRHRRENRSFQKLRHMSCVWIFLRCFGTGRRAEKISKCSSPQGGHSRSGRQRVLGA